MLNKINKIVCEKGSLMIEALAMLGLISMVTPVIYKKAAERTTEMQDVNAASQVRVMVKSIDDYLRDNYNNIINKDTVGSTSYAGLSDSKPVTLSLTDSTLAKYLPIGFKTDGKTFSGFDLAIHQKTTGSRKSLTAVMVANTKNAETFNKIRSSRIASMIGTNGGYIDGDKATGVQGVWQIAKTELPNKSAPDNTIVATSLQAIADGTAGGDNVLHRKKIDGRPELNTMETALNMGAQKITQVNTLIAATSANAGTGAEANTITLEANSAGNLKLDVDGSANIAKAIKAAISGNDPQFEVNTGGNTTIKGTTTGWKDLKIGDSGADKFHVYSSAGSMKVSGGNMTVDGTGNTVIKGTTTGWKDLQIGDSGTDKFHVYSSAGSMKVSGGNMTVNAGGSTVIKGTTSGWQDLYIGTSGTDKFRVYGTSGSMKVANGSMTVGATGNTVIKGTTSGWQDLYIGTSGTDKFRVYGTSGSMKVASGSMTVDASGNTMIKGTTTGYNDLTIYKTSNTAANKILQVDVDGTATTTSDGIYMRRGVILLPRSIVSTAVNSTGYIKADRLVGNVAATDQNGGKYTEYQVNPAYTSMMHDIKLTSRGGARLSDILPDFINKGIYVLDNTYTGNANWESADVTGNGGSAGYSLAGLKNCSSVKCDTSPWLGFIPTPNCPAGYMKVATIAPIRFNMAQAGIPVKGSIESGGVNKEMWGIGQHHDPRGKVKLHGQSDPTPYPIVEIVPDASHVNSDGTATEYAANVYNTPYNFQVSTWLNTTIKAYKNNGFKGWHGIMGFIYPAADYTDFHPVSGDASKTILWNLFPVYKEELSAIATVYCYFNRKSFTHSLVDQYLAHNQAIANIRDGDKSTSGYTGSAATGRLNDPNLTTYTDSYW